MMLKLAIAVFYVASSQAAVYSSLPSQLWSVLGHGAYSLNNLFLKPGEPAVRHCCYPDQFEALMISLTDYNLLPAEPLLVSALVFVQTVKKQY